MGGQVEYYYATPEYPVLTYNLEENVGLTLNRLLLIVSVTRYHAVVWDTISERLEGNVKEWLYKNTRPLAEQ